MRRPLPVWGFPAGYNPNLMGDRCDRCGSEGVWLERKLPPHPRWGDMGSAWTCAHCIRLRDQPLRIPDC